MGIEVTDTESCLYLLGRRQKARGYRVYYRAQNPIHTGI